MLVSIVLKRSALQTHAVNRVGRLAAERCRSIPPHRSCFAAYQRSFTGSVVSPKVRKPQHSVVSQRYFGLATACIITCATFPSFIGSTHCEDTTTSNENPLWPAGICTQDVDDFVNDILKDPSINISAIPDSLERIIYTSTVRLTLNLVYSAISQLHGMEVLAQHKFQLRRFEELHSEAMDEQHLKFMRGTAGIDEQILEQVADRLLANKAVNQVLIPDVMERQIYINCLKLIFRVMDAVAATFRITVCGHDLRLHFEPSTITKRDGGERIKAAASSMTKIDIEAVKAFARKAGVDETAAATDDFFRRMWDPARMEIVAHIHASLYALILGILDDLLANTELELLSDRIRIDIVPILGPSPPTTEETPLLEQITPECKVHSESARRSFLAPFLTGLGVGALLMAFARRE